MQVPRSAIGRTGLCPTCGTTVRINADNTTASKTSSGDAEAGDGGQTGGRLKGKKFWGGGERVSPSEDAKRKFGEAVDLYYNKRYAEALAIFNGLAREFPGNREIESGRAECLKALRDTGEQPVFGESALRLPGGTADGADFSEETVKRVVLDKMLHGASEMVQIQAAQLACQILGMLPRPAPESSAGGSEARGAEEREQAPSAVGDDGLYNPLKSYPRSIYEI